MSRGYKVVDAPGWIKASRILNPRRGPTISFPGLAFPEHVGIQDRLFERFGLDGLVGCTTMEILKRPVPQVFLEKEVEALTSLYCRWLPYIHEKLKPRLTPVAQPLNKTSRMGWPEFRNPESKRATLDGYLAQMLRSEYLDPRWEESFTVMNVRLQDEVTSKVRAFQFVNNKGEVYDEDIGEEQRKLKTPAGDRYASRTRLVFNMPIPNLMKQFWDSTVHAALLTYPAFHHDLYTPGGIRRPLQHVLAFDVKHFERHTAACVRARAEYFGRLYAAIASLFARIPFCCPTDDWKDVKFLYVDREAGYSDQFASGDSAVAPAQKEILWSLYSEWASTSLGMTRDAALEWVAQGGDSRFCIHNYGDDNFVSSTDPKMLDDVFKFMEQYLHVETESPPKFLGFLWTGDRFVLPVKSYLAKQWLNERPPFSGFRVYPFLGLIEKRKIYTAMGEPRISSEVMPAEDQELSDAGLPWSTVIERAQLEIAASRNRDPILMRPEILTDKEYLLTPDQKMASGLYEGYRADESARVVRALVRPDLLPSSF